MNIDCRTAAAAAAGNFVVDIGYTVVAAAAAAAAGNFVADTGYIVAAAAVAVAENSQGMRHSISFPVRS